MDFLSAVLPFIGSLNANETSRMNAREARQWEEDMYNKYNSPSALVRQYQEAGINPALMFGGQTPAAPTDTAAAETFQTETGSVTEMLAQLMNLDLLGVQKDEIRSRIRNQNAEAEGKEIRNKIDAQLGLIKEKYSIKEIIASIEELQEKAKMTRYQREILGPLEEKLKKATSRGLDASAAIDEWRNEQISRTGNDPTAPWSTQAASMLIDALADILEGRNPPKNIGNNLPGGENSPVTIPDYGVK